MASGTPHKAKPSTQHSLMRSANNRMKNKYGRQRERTEANKLRRAQRFVKMVQDSRSRKGGPPFDGSKILEPVTPKKKLY